jgi:hypothetical protein
MPTRSDERQACAVPCVLEGTETLPPAWQEFIRYCRKMRFGEIERLSIQNGLPVLAEVVTRKVKFDRQG